MRTSQIPIKNIANVFKKTDLQFEYTTSSGGRVALSNQIWDLSGILTWPWTIPGIWHPQLLWTGCSTASLSSELRTSSDT